ncbi:23S rRNA (adenine(2503)-C(2))-methyltransferase RlmN [Candidatus Falkowbacteria bacterium CG_4_10_14_0_8_um_filter_41_36]|uniref:23S rRNA (Adenine(2503)-C(2))-methyltransferase n=2 Tax=Candidatus Falkowiibacteriota TaxID=1752728 RepID=A0A1J4T4U5_9BACT|nr:MAG: 23S rRNA (adenine(2503)-C(2))-methyltransferase [Candidatus Falkowbacteria bacterium CG1_02_41_21]PIZ10351.1 MAG: 23S rRNA (adenine(2503)-C(2))-methyltransferase RlmN [Candidatus Falkowbacteria bacterium CG_4_10_14_0_8_um_filter_41_36]
MNIDNFYEVLKDEPAYRLKQAQKLLFGDLIDDWNQASNLPLVLKAKLNLECPIDIKAKVLAARDKKSFKALITLNDGAKIETVLMRHKEGRDTVCLSAQVGCLLGCVFCATGASGFTRNLNKNEIVEQALFWARYLKTNFKAKITNVVFMGMGEPFLNYDQVLSAIRVLNEPDGLHLGARHISISTVGLVDGIKRLANEKIQVNLAVSLHSASDKIRSDLMPINKKYSIAQLLRAVDQYIEKTNRQMMFEYMLMKGVNDSDEAAEKLAVIMNKPLYVVNLMNYNETAVFRLVDEKVFKNFEKILIKRKIKVTSRYRFGSDIAAACGQLAARK